MSNYIARNNNNIFYISDNCITIETAAGKMADIKLTHNKNNVLTVNKTSVSTCHNAMLTWLIENNNHAAAMIIARAVYNIDCISYKKQTITIANFYSSMSLPVFQEYIDTLPLMLTYREKCDLYKILINYLICSDHGGKMENIVSCSTSVEKNQYCQARRHNCPGAICAHCFAASQLKIYAAQKAKLEKSTYFFTTTLLDPDDVPDINVPFFRLESFGDLNNVTQFFNYTVIARELFERAGTLSTLWTKNPGIIKQAVNRYFVEIPDCLRIGLSSLFLNKPDRVTAARYPFIKFLFTVWENETAARAAGAVINCGARECFTCRRCYGPELNKYGNGNILEVNELLK